MQEIYYPVFNPYINEDTQMIIRPSHSSSIRYRLQYGVLLITVPQRIFDSKRIIQTLTNSTLDQCLKQCTGGYHSAILFSKDGKGHVYKLGQYIPLDYCVDQNKQILRTKKYIAKNLKKVIDPLVKKHLNELNIHDITYKISIVSSFSYLGQLSSKRDCSHKNQYSFVPEEVIGKSYTFRFSWFLGLFSVSLIDSIVTHEAVHILKQHHDKDFYNCVYTLCPNYDYLTDCIQKGLVCGEKGELK